MAYLESTGQALLDPIASLWNSFILALPGIVAALIVLIIGYLIGYFVGKAITWLIDKGDIKKKLKAAQLSGPLGHMDLGIVAGTLAKWYIFVIFFAASVDLLNLGALSFVLRSFAAWLPSLLLGIVLIVFGLVAADYAQDQMRHSKKKGLNVAAHFVQIAIIIFFALIALQQVGIDVSLATNTVLIIIGALAFGLSIAFGISLGSALKGEAKEWIKWVKKNT